MNNTKSAYGRNCDIKCCKQNEELPGSLSYAMAYVPFQQWCDDIYTADKALCHGTLFPVLDLPFTQVGRCR